MQLNGNKIISLEGNISAGKSTFIELLKKQYKENDSILFLNEPVVEWENLKDENHQNIIELFYENKENSFAFQMFALITRIQYLKDACSTHTNKIIVTERCLETDYHVFAQMLFDSKHISNIDFQIYQKMFQVFATSYPVHSVIYINTSPEKCYEHVALRGRVGEINADGKSKISLQYLQECHDYHQHNLLNRMNSILTIDIQEENNWTKIHDFIFSSF
jgi:deoxyadenosine/deoxycytidine kinase